MRITEGRLRRIIREELLHEVRITPDNLPDGITLRLKVTSDRNMIMVSARKDGDDIGWIDTVRSKDTRNSYKVVNSGAYLRGLGPLLYDIAIEAATEIGGGLMSDRLAVSEPAQRVWRRYQEDRPDIERVPLDSEDDVRIAKALGGDEWTSHPLAAAYRKPGMETIRQLAGMKKLQVLGLDI